MSFIKILPCIVLQLFAGLVTDLKKHEVSQVALGKAHVVALSSKGQVFTFGINNKGQCGRDFPSAASKEGQCLIV